MAPAPGLRHYNSGTLYYVGRTGCSWSSTITESGTYFLDFLYTGVSPNYNSLYRAYGRPLRCLQE
ncbi:MAG: hypothetical protein K2G93_07090 [Rikenella sp.]|nr:hypothetical protein [Rikenella sp.]